MYIFLGSPAAEKLREDVYQILGTANVSIREGSQASSSIAREQAARLQVQAAERQHEAALREKARRQELKRIQDEAEKREQAQIASIVDQKILALHPDIRLGVDVEKCNTRAERSSTGHVRYQVTLLKYGNGRSLDFSDPKMVFAKHTFDFDLDPDWIEGKQVTQASSSSSSAASAPAKPSTARATILFPSVPPEEISSNAFTLSDSNSDHEWLRVVMQTASVEHKNDFGTELQWRAISHEGEPVGFIVDGHKNPSEMLSLFGSRARTNTVIGDGLGGYRTIVFKEGYHIAEKRDGEWSFFSGYFGSTSRKPFYFCHTATNACSLLE